MRNILLRYCSALFSKIFPLALWLLIIPVANAGLSVNILMYHTLPGLSTANGYDVGAYLSTNADLPAAPLGHYIVTSPGAASHIEYDLTASNLVTTANYSSAYTDFNTFIQQVTNGNWTIEVTNSTSTNYFNFTISAAEFTSNVFSIAVTVTYPLANAIVPTDHPNFTWLAPAHWQGGLAVEDYVPDSDFFLYDSISPSLTNWSGFDSLPEGSNVFYVGYTSNSTSLIIASTPLNANTAAPISAWTSTSTIGTYAFIPFNVTTNIVEPPGPVSVSLSLEISRSQNSLVSNGQTYFTVFPTITSISPAPITIDRIESPDAEAYCEVSAGQTNSSSSTSTDYSSLSDLQTAMSSGPWTLYVNRGDASQQIFYFNVSAAELTTNVLSPVTITAPVAFASNVPSSQIFQWNGPAGYSSVFASAAAYPSFASDGYSSFTGNPTTWQPTTPVPAGSNVFTVTYTSNGYPNVTFTVPADTNQLPISNWTTQVQLTTYDEIVFSAASPLQVQITPATSTPIPGNFGFSFPTVSGHSHLIQVRTNLTSGAWMDLTNIPGDGSVENFSTPLTNSVPGQYFRVITQ